MSQASRIPAAHNRDRSEPATWHVFFSQTAGRAYYYEPRSRIATWVVPEYVVRHPDRIIDSESILARTQDGRTPLVPQAATKSLSKIVRKVSFHEDISTTGETLQDEGRKDRVLGIGEEVPGGIDGKSIPNFGGVSRVKRCLDTGLTGGGDLERSALLSRLIVALTVLSIICLVTIHDLAPTGEMSLTALFDSVINKGASNKAVQLRQVADDSASALLMKTTDLAELVRSKDANKRQRNYQYERHRRKNKKQSQESAGMKFFFLARRRHSHPTTNAVPSSQQRKVTSEMPEGKRIRKPSRGSAIKKFSHFSWQSHASHTVKGLQRDQETGKGRYRYGEQAELGEKTLIVHQGTSVNEVVSMRGKTRGKNDKAWKPKANGKGFTRGVRDHVTDELQGLESSDSSNHGFDPFRDQGSESKNPDLVAMSKTPQMPTRHIMDTILEPWQRALDFVRVWAVRESLPAGASVNFARGGETSRGDIQRKERISHGNRNGQRPRYCLLPFAHIFSRQCRQLALEHPMFDLEELYKSFLE